MSRKTLKEELKALKEDCRDSPYWKRKPKRRIYMVEYEEKEKHYDNLVLQSLKEYDNICGYKVKDKVCFQKHCNHNNEENESKKHEKDQNNLNLLIQAIEQIERREKEIDSLIQTMEELEKEKEEMITDTEKFINWLNSPPKTRQS
jgi:hypothetical protein